MCSALDNLGTCDALVLCDALFVYLFISDSDRSSVNLNGTVYIEPDFLYIIMQRCNSINSHRSRELLTVLTFSGNGLAVLYELDIPTRNC